MQAATASERERTRSGEELAGHLDENNQDPIRLNQSQIKFAQQPLQAQQSHPFGLESVGQVDQILPNAPDAE